ncbi:hypothetical protein [Candidatus Nitrosotalea sp. TS]|nr:hypothetical protein [Candidatus Nitrosotalea sp. TS]
MVSDQNSKNALALHKKLKGKIIVTGKIKNLKSSNSTITILYQACMTK